MFKYINFLLLAILLLIFACDEELKPVIEGCTNETACNYNSDATMDDDSCTYAEENYDCDGTCTAEVDCAGVCNGDAVENECGICNGVITNVDDCPCLEGEIEDCAGTCGGTAVDDVCGICSGDGIADGACDCDGNVLDECGICNGVITNVDDCPCLEGEIEDCAGTCGGSLLIDDCGVCGGNNGCIGCNEWYMEDFICDDAEATEKCCVENDNNNDNRCLINGTGNGCNVSACQKEYIMECDEDGEYCDYDGAAVDLPCSTISGSFTEGEGKCRNQCNLLTGLCTNIACETQIDHFCNYDGAVVGSPCSTSEGSFTEGGAVECVLNTTDDLQAWYPTGYITYYDIGCGDGTDDCCTEPECNEPFTLSLEYIDASTLQINYSSTEVISGFQFDVDGATVTGASGGAAEAAGFMISASSTTVIGFSLSGATIPIGSGIFTNLDVDTGVSTQLCLQNVVISDPESNAINSCPEYWQLTCISIP